MSISKATALGFIAGKEKAIEKVYLEYKNLMYFVIASYIPSKSDCDDILADAFLKAMEHKGEIKDPDNLKSFLASTARNEALNFIKKSRALPASPTIEELYGEEDRDNDVLSLLEPLLSSKETIVVYLKAVFSYTYEEIAESTGMSVSTVRRLYASGKEKLRKGLL